MKVLPALLLLVSVGAWGEDLWVCGTGAGAADGTSLANCWNNAVTWGTGAGQVGRGDTLYVCGTVTATLTPSGIGAFDGTVNATSDVLTIKGTAAQCGGAQGIIDVSSGHGINGSGVAALYIEDLTCAGTGATSNCFNQLFGTAAACVASAGYYCGRQSNLTCSGAGVHCANMGSSAATNFPAVAVTGLYQSNITSSGAGGAACIIGMHATGAIQDNCQSFGDGLTTNTWGVYQRGVTLNCGAANSGAGVTWTLVSGTVYKTAQSNCGSSINTVIDVFAANPATNIPARLTLDAACVDDSSCGTELTAGEYGVVTGTVYVNKGDAPVATAAVYLTYAWATNGIIRNAHVEDFSDLFDGFSMGHDFGTDGGLIEQSYSLNAPVYGAVCGGGQKNCEIRSSISVDSGSAGFLCGGGPCEINNVSSSGSTHVAAVRTFNGDTITVRNATGSGLTAVVTDLRGEGTLVEATNSADPQFAGGTNPTTVEGFKPAAGSPLCAAGTSLGSVQDYGNRRFKTPPAIGAWSCGSGSPRTVVRAAN